MTEPIHIKQLLPPWLSRETTPKCQARINTGELCNAPAYRKVGRRWLCEGHARALKRKA